MLYTSFKKDLHGKYIALISGVISMIVLFGTGIYMAYISWQKWADVVIDFGVELYIPWQLTKGKILCRDIWQLYGPFSQYFNSMIFRVFGVGFMKLALFNIVLIIVLGYVLYRIFLELTDRITATAVVAFFLSVFAFSQYVGYANYNYVCPYSHELTHGILLSFVVIYIFMNFVKSRSPALLSLMGILTGVILLTKLEVFCAIFSAILIGLICFIITNRLQIRDAVKVWALFLSWFSLPAIFFLIYFSRHMDPLSALKAMMMQYNLLTERSMISEKFPMWVMGLDRPSFNLKMLMAISLKYIFVIMSITLSSFFLSSLKTQIFKRITMGSIFIALIVLIPSIIKKAPWMEMGRPLPVIVLLLGVYILISLLLSLRNPQKAGSMLPLLVLAVFSFCMLFKMILNAHVYHYGFVLAMPASLLSVMLFTYRMPNYLGRLFGSRKFIRLINLVLIATVIVAHIGLSRKLYALKTFQFSGGVDAIKTWDWRMVPQGACGSLALEEIDKIMGKNETFVVFPEGMLYNYLARRDNPTPYYDFKPTPVHIWGKLYLDSLKKNKPDYIVLTERDTSDIGERYFGRDYALDLYSWIKDNYKVVYQIGSPLTGAGYGVSISKRIR